MYRSPTSQADTNQAPANSRSPRFWPSWIRSAMPGPSVSNIVPAPPPTLPWPGSRATCAPEISARRLRRRPQAVLECAAQLFDELDRAVNAGAHVYARVDLAELGDGGGGVLQVL